MAIAVEATIKLDVPYGAVDYATLEHAIHTACAEARLPVIDVEVGQTVPIDSPLQDPGLPAPDSPLGPLGSPVTRAPGARRI